MKRSLPAVLALALLAPSASALEVPFLSGRVNDDARLLDPGAAARLEQTLKAHEAKTGQQVVVLTIPSLEGEVLEDFSLKVSRTWKLGRTGKNDGILLLISKNDRKMRIETGYGLEGALPDALCGRIIRDEIVPRFRENDFSGGISAGVDAILAAIAGDYTPTARSGSASGIGRNDFAGMGLLEKILISCFVFGMLGLFEGVGVLTPGMGWFLYFFLIPFWAAFPMAIWGAKIGTGLLGTHLIGFPFLKMLLPKTQWGKSLAQNIHVRGGGAYIGGSGWSSGNSGGSGGFSGGGGSFGGGGSSGSW